MQCLLIEEAEEPDRNIVVSAYLCIVAGVEHAWLLAFLLGLTANADLGILVDDKEPRLLADLNGMVTP